MKSGGYLKDGLHNKPPDAGVIHQGSTVNKLVERLITKYNLNSGKKIISKIMNYPAASGRGI